MKQLSIWASNHRATAIAIIISVKVMMGFAAFYLGQLFAEANFIFSPYTVYFLAIAFLATVYLYPRYKSKYLLRKGADYVMMSCAFLTVAAVSNNINTIKITTPYVQAAYNIKPPVTSSVSPSTKHGKNLLTKLEKKTLRKHLFKQGKILSALMAGPDPNAKKRTTAIVLIILLALVTGFFLSGLVCSLSCNGSDAAAVLVGVVGLGGIIWGAAALIKSTNRKYPSNPGGENKPVPTTN